MRRTEQAQGLRLMKFEEVYGRTRRGVPPRPASRAPSGAGATALRPGAEGLRPPPGSPLGAPAPRGGAGAGAVRHPLLGLHRQALPREAGGRARLRARTGCGTLQAYGPRAAPRRGAHRRKRPRRALPGMMVHQDGSRHEWLAGRPPLDLIVTLDDATSEIYSAFFATNQLDREIPRTILTRRTLLKRLPQELRLAGITGIAGQPLPQGSLPAPTQRPLRGDARGRRLSLRPLRRRARLSSASRRSAPSPSPCARAPAATPLPDRRCRPMACNPATSTPARA